jgi:cation diffusion facilitator family transporter
MSGAHAHHDHGAYGDRAAVRAVLVSGVALGTASVIEFAASFSSHSASVLADALHNAGDVLTTFVLLFAFALARRPATRRFPSGFGRIEDVATLLIVLVIAITAAVAAYASIRKFFDTEAYTNLGFALFGALVGVVANLAVSEYKIRVGRRLNSSALCADGVHSRVDALVSAGAFAGIGLAGLGLRLADPIAGLVITAAIILVTAGTVKQLFLRMMDAVDPDLTGELIHAALEVDGVLGVNDVRARWVGRELIAVMHIACRPEASVSEAHEIALRVEHSVAHHLPAARLDIHMDPGTTAHSHGEPRGEHPGEAAELARP